MAPSRHYTRLSNPRASLHADREMDAAFDDDDKDDHGETAPLTFHQPQTPVSAGHHPQPLPSSDAPSTATAYDFERDYDYPPPGSPPSLAFPNDFGNSNGFLPTSPIVRSYPQPQPMSMFRRMFGAVLPQSYERVRSGDDRPRGGGTDNDGVFANVTAKPTLPISIRRVENGEVHIVPEESQEEAPPSYMVASIDAAPSYWETIVHAPAGLDLNGDMIIDELPTGSVLVFVLTTLISWFFQLPGFILTYLLHGTHAGRYGSQAGLALTLIQWGLGTTVMGAFPTSDDPPPLPPRPHPPHPPPPPPSGDPGFGSAVPGAGSPPEGALPVGGTPQGGMIGNVTRMGEGGSQGGSTIGDFMQGPYTGHEWISFLLMTIGWFLLLTSMIGYFRVKRFELSVRASRTVPPELSTEDVQRDVALRRNLQDVFGMSVVFDSESAAAAAANLTPHSTDTVRQSGIFRAIEEVRLQNDLRNAGLL